MGKGRRKKQKRHKKPVWIAARAQTKKDAPRGHASKAEQRRATLLAMWGEIRAHSLLRTTRHLCRENKKEAQHTECRNVVMITEYMVPRGRISSSHSCDVYLPNYGGTKLEHIL